VIVYLKYVVPILASAAVFGYGVHVGKNIEQASYLEQEQLINEAADKATLAAVEALQNIKLENKTYVKNFRTIEKRETVYRDCKHDATAYGLLNDALAGTESKQSVSPELPK
jgi:hypothetical protein